MYTSSIKIQKNLQIEESDPISKPNYSKDRKNLPLWNCSHIWNRYAHGKYSTSIQLAIGIEIRTNHIKLLYLLAVNQCISPCASRDPIKLDSFEENGDKHDAGCSQPSTEQSAYQLKAKRA